MNANKILIGNKCDVQDQRVSINSFFAGNMLPELFLLLFQVISTDEGNSLAKEYNINFFETSAKQDMNVEKAFITIATDVKNRLISDGNSGGTSGGHKLAPGGGSTAAKKGCC